MLRKAFQLLMRLTTELLSRVLVFWSWYIGSRKNIKSRTRLRAAGAAARQRELRTASALAAADAKGGADLARINRFDTLRVDDAGDAKRQEESAREGAQSLSRVGGDCGEQSSSRACGESLGAQVRCARAGNGVSGLGTCDQGHEEESSGPAANVSDACDERSKGGVQ
eukprot:1608781-Rhodomonas_salina.1